MVSLESEGEMTRRDVAGFLHEFADELLGIERVREDETLMETDTREPTRMTFIIGGDSATVTIPERVEFEVEIESRSPLLASGVQQEIEFELSWEVEEVGEASENEQSIQIE